MFENIIIVHWKISLRNQSILPFTQFVHKQSHIHPHWLYISHIRALTAEMKSEYRILVRNLKGRTTGKT